MRAKSHTELPRGSLRLNTNQAPGSPVEVTRMSVDQKSRSLLLRIFTLVKGDGANTKINN